MGAANESEGGAERGAVLDMHTQVNIPTWRELSHPQTSRATENVLAGSKIVMLSLAIKRLKGGMVFHASCAKCSSRERDVR
jgi:hypothetical protein